jgi:hypothetical protein
MLRSGLAAVDGNGNLSVLDTCYSDGEASATSYSAFSQFSFLGLSASRNSGFHKNTTEAAMMGSHHFCRP